MESFDKWLLAADNASETRRVFVLAAAAGVGKTNIACKLATECSDVVVACHFCQRDDNRRNNSKDAILSLPC
jgi:flagellar biosynthesis GTPase FlhF